MAPLVLNLFLVTVLLAGFAWTQLTPGCNVEEGIDYWGNDISGYFNYFVKDMEQCMGDCAKVEQCNFWTYRPASLSGSLPASVSGSLSGSLAGSLSGSLPACWLKTSSSGRKPADWAVSGAKICGGSGSGSGSTCKPLKTMGGVNYTLIEEAETEDWGCSSDCVYQKQGVPSEKWCFKPGGSSVTCGLSKYTEEECPELVAFQKATMSKDEELYLVLKDLIKCCKEKPQASSNETYINQTIINLNETVNNLICNVNHISTTQQTIIKGFTRMSEVMARLDQHGAQCGYKAMWEQAKTIITFDNTFTNDGVGSLDAATGMWTAGVSGTYAISISGYSQHDFRGENMLNLFKNGASLGKKGEWMFAEYGKDSGGRSLVLKLAKDDKLTLKAGDMASATANNNKTFIQDLDFCVFLINADSALTKANTTDWPANKCPASLDATSTTTTTTTTSTTTTTTTATTTTTTTTVPKGWTKVFSHNTTGGLFNGSMSDALSKNPTSPSSLLFSTLSTLEDSRRPDGSFLLRICYPELQAGEALPCNEWSQTSNPATDAFITDFRAVRLQFPENSYEEDWGGLGVSPASVADTFIDDTPDRSYWWFAVAASSYYPRGNTEGTIPGPYDKSVKKVEMYAFTAVTGMRTVYTQPSGELELTRDKLLTTLPTLGKEWEISFQFKPTKYDNSGYNDKRGWTNLIHLTIGGDAHILGDRTPAIFFNPDLSMAVATAIGSTPSAININNITPPPVGEWSTLTLTQLKSGATTTFSATINGVAPFRPVVNTTPREFSNVKVFASDNFYTAQPGLIKNLVIKTSF